MTPARHDAASLVGGSLIGSIAETQAVLDLRAEHGIAPDVQIIPIEAIDEADRKVKAGDVRCRYGIDAASLAQEKDEAA